MAEQTQFVLRTQSNFSGMYGVGEMILPGITLFRDGNYDLDRENAERILALKRKQTNA